MNDEQQSAEEGVELDESSTTNRRALLGKGAAAAAVAAVAGLSTSRVAQAANGDTVVVGGAHSGTLTTEFKGGTTLQVNEGSSEGSASIYGAQAGNAGSYGVRGSHGGTAGVGVYGNATGSGGYGVYGHNTGSFGAGVYGEHEGGTKSGAGVRGISDNGPGVLGQGSNYDLQARGTGRVGLSAVGQAGSANDAGSTGTIARDATGNLWYCHATDQWEQISGVTQPAPPPQFTPITPIRAYDSRIGAIPQSGVFTANANKVISIKDGRDQTTGAIDAADAVPAGAKAVAFNVTATNTTAGSFLAVVPGDVASSAVSSLNWSGGGISIANAGIVGVDGSLQVRVIAGPGGSFDAIIDITGYFI